MMGVGTPAEKLAMAEIEMNLVRDELEGEKAAYQLLPRGNKKLAHESRVRIAQLESQLRSVRAEVREHREVVERKERHGLWVQAVVAVAGEDALAKCVAWMQEERRRRRDVA